MIIPRARKKPVCCRDREDSGCSAQRCARQPRATHLPPKPCPEPEAVTHAPETSAPTLLLSLHVGQHGTDLHVGTISETLQALSGRHYMIGFAACADNERQSSRQPGAHIAAPAVRVWNILRGPGKHGVYIKKSNRVMRPSVYPGKSLKSP